jgi:DNA-binding MarR family transcriptional regulator
VEAHDTPAELAPPSAASGGPISYAIFRLSRIHRARAAQLLRRVGLHLGQELLMMRLWESGPQRQVDLATEFGTHSAGMTRIVQRLERAGYVRRVPDPDDRRATRVEPTAASLALRGQVEEIWAELERLTVGTMSAAQQREALDATQRLEINLLAAPIGEAPAVDDS